MAQVSPCLAISLLLFSTAAVVVVGDDLDIGVCYGMQGDNLPPATEVISLYTEHRISKIRLFDPNPDALNALRGSKMLVSLGIKNEDIPNIASSVDAASAWLQTNYDPYKDVIFAYIAVGNEYPIPSAVANSVVQAMKNLRSALDSRGRSDQLVTTVVTMDVIARGSFPPSVGDFSAEAKPTMVGILQFLTDNTCPLMVNIYPYYAYVADPANIRLDYATFTATEPVVIDRDLKYYNLFDAMIDTFSWAIEKQGFSVGIAASESGWPSAGNGAMTTPELASTYNKNFVKYILSRVGTPKRPGAYIDTFIFAMFNENQKPGGVEQNWGLYYPNKQPVYPCFD